MSLKKLPESTASPRKIKAKERRIEALQLRKEGHTYAEIAKILGFASESGARKTVKQALKNFDEIESTEAHDLRTINYLRYETIIKSNWYGVLVGDKDAAATAMKAMEGERKMMGVDAPEKYVFELSPSAVKLLEMMGLNAGSVAAEFESLIREMAKKQGIEAG